MLVHTNATHGASEQMLPGTRDPVGQPQPHGWFAASIVNLVRDLLVRERASELHLLSALSPEWLRRRGDVVRVTRAPTYFGEIDLRLERLDAALGIDLTARFHTAPARVVLHVPWYLADRLRRVTADGVEIALPPGKPESIPLAPGARRVELALADWPDLPEISYRSAVARFLEDFERTRGWWSAWSRSGKRPPGDEPR
jgi:hypothetical protein